MTDALDTLLAKQAIYELSCRYMRGLDRLDADLLRSLFWADGWCEYGFIDTDPDAFIDYCMQALAGHAANQHLIGNVLVDVEGDEAFGEVYFQAYHKIPNEQGGHDDLLVAGRYLDRYQRRDGEWRFAYRSERVDWSHSRPTSDPYFELVPNGLRGGRQDDALYDRGRRRRP